MGTNLADGFAFCPSATSGPAGDNCVGPGFLSAADASTLFAKVLPPITDASSIMDIHVNPPATNKLGILLFNLAITITHPDNI